MLATTFVALIAITCTAQAAPLKTRRDADNASGDTIFDYVVIGGGTAGLAVATRLVQGSSHSVAVIEAGGFYEQDNGNLSIVPGYALAFAGTDPKDFNPLVDWGFATEPQKNVNDRRIHYARGKTLGGSSARNAMFYHRPTAGSLDKWADEVGDDSYRLQNLLPHYKKSVHYSPPTVPFINATFNQAPADVWSSTGGPLQASHGKYFDPFGAWMQRAMTAIGLKPINGFQSGRLIGSAFLPFTVDPDKAHRSSSESSYLQSVQDKPNLKVYHNTLAQRIILDARNRATGVVAVSQGAGFTLRAKEEVILSAGAFQSPQLLMLSGIGPRTQLAALNITVKLDLPGVGSNLIDHPLLAGSQHRVVIPTVSAALNNPLLNAAAVQAYDTLAAGPLTIPTTGFLGWEKLPLTYRKNLTVETRKALDTSFPSDWPELEILPFNAAAGTQRNYLTADPVDGHNYATIGISMVAPLSRGTVSISSTLSSDPPIIDPAYLSHPGDQEVAIAAIKRVREVWAAVPELTAGLGSEWLPGPQVQSDTEILGYVKDSLAPTWHAAGTCKMGKQKDKMAVVDPKGRVYGTSGLRVVDASIFPLLPPGHPQATVYALAEKLVESVLEDGKENDDGEALIQVS